MRVNPYQVEVVGASDLTGWQELDLVALAKESLAADNDTVEPAYIARYQIATRGLYQDLNTGTYPGGPLDSGARQRFSNQATALVIDNERNALVASLTFADNASSRKTGIVATAEIKAKLGMPDMPVEKAQRFIRSRYRYLGQISVSNLLRQELAEADPDEASILDALVARAARDALPQQRVSAFTWRQEILQKRTLDNAGLENEGVVGKAYQPFGPDNPPVILEHWQADRAGDIAGKVGAMRHGEIMLAAAGVELRE